MCAKDRGSGGKLRAQPAVGISCHASKASDFAPNFVVVPGKEEDQAVCLAAKQQTNVQTNAALENVPPHPADAKPRMLVRPAKLSGYAGDGFINQCQFADA